MFTLVRLLSAATSASHRMGRLPDAPGELVDSDFRWANRVQEKHSHAERLL
jgi:hypothetical protein